MQTYRGFKAKTDCVPDKEIVFLLIYHDLCSGVSADSGVSVTTTVQGSSGETLVTGHSQHNPQHPVMVI